MDIIIYKFNKIKYLSGQSGISLILVAILISAFLGIAALAVDLGYLYVARNQLQNAVDAGALAGARKLGDNYVNNISPYDTGVQAQAEQFAANNKVTNLTLDSGNLTTEIKCWDSNTLIFSDCSGVNPNAVKVTATRATGTTSGGISTFFANIWNIQTVDEGASAIAALGGPCTAKSTIPIGIADGWFSGKSYPADCGGTFGLNSTPSQCGAWTTLSSLNVNDGNGSMNIRDLLENPSKIPVVNVGQTADFNNGTLNSALKDLQDMVVAASNHLEVFIPVFHANCGDTYSGTYTIVGFASAIITAVYTSGGTHGFDAQIECTTQNGKGACTNYFTLDSIPGLVK